MQRWWVYLTVVVILASTGAFIGRLRLSEIPDLAVGQSPQLPRLGAPRVQSVSYELAGTAGTPAMVSYIDVDGRSRTTQVRLPWTLTLHSRQVAFSAGVAGSTDGSDVSCRVLIDGALRADQQGSAVANCQVPVS